ncbi:MAG: DUF1848 domain-containing protein [Desulfobacteraceae bacterium]|nr:DUF1848 domain-containing protein [Desulfobacteraceae bacterium]
MDQNPVKIISASRRTDIPAFYLDWFMEHIHLGFFNVKNPYTKAIKKVEVSKESIHSIVFWSKNYHSFIKENAGKKLAQLGFNLYFNFTINSVSDLLEPKIPPLKERLEQLRILAMEFGPRNIAWRFDPICFYKTQNNGPIKNNLSDFPTIAHHAAEFGIKKCITSFFDTYKKIQKRVAFLSKKSRQNIVFIAPSMDKKRQVIHRMEKVLAQASIPLYLCCEKQVFLKLCSKTGIKQNSCIDGHLLKTNFGGTPEVKRDYGQRSKQGCLCTKSIDIGSYDMHPCFHNCLFCYANPDIDNILKNNANEN